MSERESFSPSPAGETAASLVASLAENIAQMERLFTDVDILVKHSFRSSLSHELSFCLFYSDGVVNSQIINDFIVRPLSKASRLVHSDHLLDEVRQHLVQINEIKLSSAWPDIVQSVCYGDSILFVEGCSQALILNTKGFSLRSISEPENEKVLAGPREGFTEGIMLNLSLLRRRLRTHQLKMKMRSLGLLSQTSICICYMDNIVNKHILRELERRLQLIEIDAVLDANYIAEYISEGSSLGFNTIATTERPDVVAAKLLEGRIALFVDGTPTVLTLPHLFIENVQSNEDYYVNAFYASFSRMLRIVGFFLAVLVSPMYVAIVTHHHELLPTQLIISIASERHVVPLPAALEAFLLLLTFDILRETGIRMPTGIGQALSIVGALVIGQSAVEAGLVTAPMIIIVAFTGITNLLVPRLNTASLILRYGFLALASAFGLFGLAVGIAIMITHIVCLQSFGVPQLIPMEDLSFQDVKDTFIRAPWPYMLTRISPLTGNRARAKKPPAKREEPAR